ncbi:hypothetical protein M409DRAFT_61742, partial [Zasmidium cellare ATCC 36951]
MPSAMAHFARIAILRRRCFGPPEAAYSKEVKHQHEGGAETIGKQQFTLLYSRARQAAFSARKIRAGWWKAGVFPFNFKRVLQDMPKQVAETETALGVLNVEADADTSAHSLRTPTPATSLYALRRQLEGRVDSLDKDSKNAFK